MSKHRINANLIRCPVCGSIIAEKDSDCDGINVLCKKCKKMWHVAVAGSQVTITQKQQHNLLTSFIERFINRREAE